MNSPVTGMNYDALLHQRLSWTAGDGPGLLTSSQTRSASTVCPCWKSPKTL